MLRLESCLRGEATQTIKGLARLQRKYGGDRRKVQTQIDELRKLKPFIEGDPKSMDKFADILEKTVVVLKDNSLHGDSGGGTLYGIVVEKLPENSLKQYYRWVKEQDKDETMETLKERVAEEAYFQMQASEVKHGFTSRSGDRKHEDSRWSRRDGKSSKSFGTSLQEGNKHPNNLNEDGERKRKLCRACGESHHIENYKITKIVRTL